MAASPPKAIRPARRRPDPALAAEAVDRFLDALGLPPSVRRSEDLGRRPAVSVDEVLEPRLRDPPRRVGEVLGAARRGRAPERVEEPVDRLRRERGIRPPPRRADRLDPSGHPAPGT